MSDFARCRSHQTIENKRQVPPVPPRMRRGVRWDACNLLKTYNKSHLSHLTHLFQGGSVRVCARMRMGTHIGRTGGTGGTSIRKTTSYESPTSVFKVGQV